MVYDMLKTLVEKLSCDIVLIDPDDPKSLSALLPQLKQVHLKCRELSLSGEAKQVKKAKKLVKQILEFKNPEKASRARDELNDIISGLTTDIYSLEAAAADGEQPEKEPPAEESRPEEEKQGQDIPMEQMECTGQDLDAIQNEVDRFSSVIAGFCPGEIPDLGAMLNILEALIEQADRCEPDTLSRVAQACRHYVENMTLEEINNTRPIEEAVVLFNALIRHMKKGAPFIFDTQDVMAILEPADTAALSRPEDDTEIPPDPASALPQDKDADTALQQPGNLTEDDMEIMADFISEARDNLENIEIHLVELEQDPTDKDIINNIFRPFHTIKGVSGFLSLDKINKLSHTTENLLDAARNDEFLINDIATDAVLHAVDTLKLLILRVEEGLSKGLRPMDKDIDIDSLRKKLVKIQKTLTENNGLPLGEILVRQGKVSAEEIAASLDHQKASPGRKIGEILVEGNKISPEDVNDALFDQRSGRKKVTAHVKVSTEKLDDLVDYAGELVIAQSMLRQKLSSDPELYQNVGQLNLIVSKIQHIAMSMRMIPIKATFMKMIRLVRDLSQKSGKQAGLKMAGEDTEIDRNVVDALYEPMVHMIRNAVDHGIEPARDRKKSDKPSKGTIFLRAYHKGGHIVIEIEDDGKGLDKDVILQKALDRDLVSPDDNLSDEQIYNLILAPGFSTAREITDVSGRGVGMDVVTDGIDKFRGHLNITSEKGKGTKFTISLPLTLAIIDGMLVRVAADRYVIPTTAIQRVFRPGKEDCFTVEGREEMIKEKDSLIPLIRLHTIFNSKSEKIPAWEALVVVVESKGEKRGLLIDELLGKDEFVIKSLGANLENIQGLSGGAILADGKVGLILDVQGIFSIARKS